MQISVVVPFFQAEHTIRSCIEGLLAQDLPRKQFEILMIDNNSTDGSTAIAREYPEVTLLRESKQGAYAARNRGLTVACGGLIAFTDPDCVPRPDWLRRLSEPFSCPRVQIVVGRALLARDSLLLTTLQDYERSRDELVLSGDDALLFYGRTNNMAVRRRVFDELGPFVERRRGADSMLVRRCADRYSCGAVRYEPSAEVVHLEVDRPATYYRKVFTYGRSLASSKRVVPHRILGRRERWRVFRSACGKHGYSRSRSCLLLLLLALEGAVWKLGSLSAAVEMRAGRRPRE